MFDLLRTPKEKAAVKRQVLSVVYKHELFVRELKASVAVTVVVGRDYRVTVRSKHFCGVVSPEDNGVVLTTSVNNVKDNVSIGIDTTDSAAVLTLSITTVWDVPAGTSFSSRDITYAAGKCSN